MIIKEAVCGPAAGWDGQPHDSPWSLGITCWQMPQTCRVCEGNHSGYTTVYIFTRQGLAPQKNYFCCFWMRRKKMNMAHILKDGSQEAFEKLTYQFIQWPVCTHAWAKTAREQQGGNSAFASLHYLLPLKEIQDTFFCRKIRLSFICICQSELHNICLLSRRDVESLRNASEAVGLPGCGMGKCGHVVLSAFRGHSQVTLM